MIVFTVKLKELDMTVTDLLITSDNVELVSRK